MPRTMPPSTSGPDTPGVISRETLAFERLLAELSARFINLPAAEIDGAITDALQQIALLLDVDRAQLVRLAADSVELSHSWAVEGVFASVPPKRITQLFPWAIQRVRAGPRRCGTASQDVPPEAHVDKATWQQNGVRSILGTPMKVAGRVEGAIAIACLRRARDWPDDLVIRMGVLAEVFANALAHKRAREAHEVAIEFERNVSSILAALLTAPPSEHDRVIEAGLGDMARMLEVDDAALWQRVGQRSEFTTTHRWGDERHTHAARFDTRPHAVDRSAACRGHHCIVRPPCRSPRRSRIGSASAARSSTLVQPSWCRFVWRARWWARSLLVPLARAATGLIC